jgi:hypothetical protein
MTAPEILYKMESDILMNMLKALNAGNIGSATWQAQKLAQLGIVRSLNINTINDNLRIAIEEIQEEIQESVMKGALSVDATQENLADFLPANADPKVKAVFDGWYRKTGNEFNRMGASMLVSADKIYTNTVNSVTAEVLAGSKTGRQAIAETATDWAKKGLSAFKDSAGREWSTEAYAQTIIRTTQRNARREAGFARMDELGLDLIEISSHIGAREGCAPYQGKVYSRSGNNPNYPALSETTYGEPAGIFGINCTHNAIVYKEGSRKTFSPYPVKENEQAYENSQKQRSLERAVRAEKRGLQEAMRGYDLSIASGATAKAQEYKAQAEIYKQRVSARQEKLRDFIDETGRTRRYDREQIYGG